MKYPALPVPLVRRRWGKPLLSLKEFSAFFHEFSRSMGARLAFYLEFAAMEFVVSDEKFLDLGEKVRP